MARIVEKTIDELRAAYEEVGRELYLLKRIHTKEGETWEMVLLEQVYLEEFLRNQYSEDYIFILL